MINWDLYASDDPRILLGYVVYSTEAPIKNVTLYDGRDACGGDGSVFFNSILKFILKQITIAFSFRQMARR